MSQKKQCKIKLLNGQAKFPTVAYNSAACFDLYAASRVRIPGASKRRIPTGIAMEIPKGHWVKVYDRSGVGGDTPLTVVAGVIDEDYRGEVMIIMVNESEYPYDVEAGMKIAQFAFHEKPQIELVEAQELSETVRGEKGFGSTDAQTT